MLQVLPEIAKGTFSKYGALKKAGFLDFFSLNVLKPPRFYSENCIKKTSTDTMLA
jgi:hypothetical protein